MSAEGSQDKVATQIMIAMILGLVFGFGLHHFGVSDWVDPFKPLGDIFIRLLKMVIVPLVTSSIFMAMVNLGTPKELGAMGTKAIAYYFITTSVAVFIGVIVVNVIQPGVGVDLSIKEALSTELSTKLDAQKGLFETFIGVITNAIPSNPFESMSKGTVLQIIVFAILFGILALFHRDEAKPFIDFMRSIEFLSLRLTFGIMKLAPIGIFVLMMSVVARSGFSAIKALGWYMFAVIVGLGAHFLLLLIVGSWRAKKSPLFILKGLASPVLTAFTTASSAATLPITMTATQTKLNVNEKTAKFVLPLGATINMDGTALYESVAVIFIGQAYGIPMPLSVQAIIFLTASLAAVGAAAIPGAGLITMTIVLNAVGFPVEGIGLILAVDRILDMFRTAVNVFGDAIGTVVVDSLTPTSDGN